MVYTSPMAKLACARCAESILDRAATIQADGDLRNWIRGPVPLYAQCGSELWAWLKGGAAQPARLPRRPSGMPPATRRPPAERTPLAKRVPPGPGEPSTPAPVIA